LFVSTLHLHRLLLFFTACQAFTSTKENHSLVMISQGLTGIERYWLVVPTHQGGYHPPCLEELEMGGYVKLRRGVSGFQEIRVKSPSFWKFFCVNLAFGILIWSVLWAA